MLSTKLYSIFLFCVNCCVAQEQFAPVIETRNGPIIGLGMSDGLYHAYKSIPYAKAPLGELRFAAPEPLSSNWAGTLQATSTAPKCLQWSTLDRDSTVVGSEDCLYLNVFVPHTSTVHENPGLLPVVVFIHGGGFMWGSADFYGEEHIMQHGGLILVTMNYRLGPFGFLSTEDDEIVGNFGLKDQALALQWVYENIEYFMGNKQQILLAGWSAGGASVNYHMVSQATKDEWFSSAASLSGTALCPCHAIYPEAARKKAQLLALYVGCPSAELSTTKGIKTCLKRTAAEDIAHQIPQFYKFSHHPFAIFGPVLENASCSNSFLTDHVENLLANGHAKGKPWLLGTTAQDGAVAAAEFLQRGEDGRELIYKLADNWSEWAPIMLFFNASLSREQHTKQAMELKRKYFAEDSISVETYKQLETLFDNEMNIKHVKQLIELYYNSTANAAIYGYVYDNPPPFGLGQIVSQRDDLTFSTLHGDDIFLMFATEVRRENPFRSDEQQISKNFIDMLVQMAKTQTPVYDGRKLPKLEPRFNFQFSKITTNGLQV